MNPVAEAITERQPLLFDYAAMETENRLSVQRSAQRIRRAMRRTADDVIEIGRELLEVRDRLGWEQFGNGLLAEFNWQADYAARFMITAEKFGAAPLTSNISASALLLLAGPRAPEEARAAAAEMAAGGATVTREVARAVVRATRTAQTQQIQAAQIALPAAPEPEPEFCDECDAPLDESSVLSAELAEKREVKADPEWGKARVTLTLQFLPEDGHADGRQCLLSAQANDLPPVMKLRRAGLDCLPDWISSVIAQLEEKFPQLRDEEQKRKQENEAAKKKAPPAGNVKTKAPAKAKTKPQTAPKKQTPPVNKQKTKSTPPHN
jgi:hypothetical protein